MLGVADGCYDGVGGPGEVCCEKAAPDAYEICVSLVVFGCEMREESPRLAPVIRTVVFEEDILGLRGFQASSESDRH